LICSNCRGPLIDSWAVRRLRKIGAGAIEARRKNRQGLPMPLSDRPGRAP